MLYVMFDIVSACILDNLAKYVHNKRGENCF